MARRPFLKSKPIPAPRKRRHKWGWYALPLAALVVAACAGLVARRDGPGVVPKTVAAGQLPARASGRIPPVKVPAQPPKPSGPRIAIVIDDLGLSARRTARFTDLPVPLTGSFLPYADHLDAQTRSMQAAGKEIMVHLPMEPKDAHRDPGPNALLEGLTSKEFQRRLAWNLDRLPRAVGVNNHMGSRLTEDRAAMDRVMAELAERKLFYLDSVTTRDSVGAARAARVGLAEGRRNLFIDNIRDEAAIRKQLAVAEAFARRHGQVIAIGHPYGETANVLAEWAPEAEKRGFRFVTVSELLQAPAVIAAR